MATDVVANLLRDELTAWVDPMLVALNSRLELDEPITGADAQAHLDEDRKLWPLLMRPKLVQRWWNERVRRQTHEWFIWSTFDS